MITIGGNSFVRAWITEDYDRAAGIGTMIIGMTLKKEREKERERERERERESAFIGESAMSESMGVEPVASERERKKERKKERKRERESAMPESTGV